MKTIEEVKNNVQIGRQPEKLSKKELAKLRKFGIEVSKE